MVEELFDSGRDVREASTLRTRRVTTPSSGSENDLRESLRIMFPVQVAEETIFKLNLNLT